jgi:HlyD family secretion protein
VTQVDHPLHPAQLRRQAARRILRATVPIALVASVLLWGPGWIRPSLSRSRIRTAKVDTGPLEAVITASGTVVPEVEQVVPSPVDARVLRILKRPGDPVTKGDPVLELDLQGSILAVEKLDQDLALKANQQARTRLDLESRLNELESQRQIKSLQLQQYRSQLRRNQELAKSGLIADEVLKQSELAEAQATIELRKLEEDKRNAERATRTQVEGLALEMATLRRERDEARRQLHLATTKADRDGVVTWMLTEEGVSVRKGDVIARIADLRSFRVEATVSDVHAKKLAVGLPATVRVGEGDAVLEGVVSSVSPRVENGAITLGVALAQKTSPLLRSNLRVDVLVVTGRKPRALRIKRGPFAEGEGQREAFVVQGDRAVRRTVRLGLASFDQIEVVEGLSEGDEVVISDMTDYAHLREVGIK